MSKKRKRHPSLLPPATQLQPRITGEQELQAYSTRIKRDHFPAAFGWIHDYTTTRRTERQSCSRLTACPVATTLSNLAGIGQVHQYPTRSTRSGLVRQTERAGVLLAFGVFEELTQAFIPTPSTPDSRTIRDALDAPDANE
jgi:hypothetical protein